MLVLQGKGRPVSERRLGADGYRMGTIWLAESCWRGAEPSAEQLNAGCSVGRGRVVGTPGLLDTVAAVRQSMIVWSVLNITNMEEYGDGVAAFMNKFITHEQLLVIAKRQGLYQGTTV